MTKEIGPREKALRAQREATVTNNRKVRKALASVMDKDDAIRAALIARISLAAQKCPVVLLHTVAQMLELDAER